MDIGVQSDSSSDSSSSSSSDSETESDSDEENVVNKSPRKLANLTNGNVQVQEDEQAHAKKRKLDDDQNCAVKNSNLNRELNVNRYYKS